MVLEINLVWMCFETCCTENGCKKKVYSVDMVPYLEATVVASGF